jgi:hypothetical protein
MERLSRKGASHVRSFNGKFSGNASRASAAILLLED